MTTKNSPSQYKIQETDEQKRTGHSNPSNRINSTKQNTNKDEPSRSSATTVINRPRNYLIQDATTPYMFNTQLLPSSHYSPINKPRDITLHIHQSCKEETWPGGALWDIGVLLSKFFVILYNHHFGSVTPSVPQQQSSRKKKQSTAGVSSRWLIPAPPTPQQQDSDISNTSCTSSSSPFTWPTCYTWWKNAIVLELGCGVGLTALAVSAMFQNKLTLLTDLPLVIDEITKENIRLNESVLGPSSRRKQQQGSSNHPPSKIHAVPLCWGNKEDEVACAQYIQKQHQQQQVLSTPSSSKVGKKNVLEDNDNGASTTTVEDPAISTIQPHLILIGDVAYQHKPGAPCHFDALLQTVLAFVGDDTLVIFGTRMRMPASMDLLEMFQSQLMEVIHPPIEAHEIDTAFRRDNLQGKKHNITIHVFKKKKNTINGI